MHSTDVHLERRERPAEAGNLHGRQVGDRVAAVESRPQPPLARAVEHLECERGVLHERRDVRNRAVGEIVDPDDLMSVREQSLAQIGADESRSPRYTDPSHWFLLSQMDSVRSGRAPSNVSWAGATMAAARL